MNRLLHFLIFAVIALSPQVSFATDVPLGFTGQEQHSDSLLDYGARYYDADLARFPQADRVDVFEMTGNPQDLNAYAYVKNNPVNRVDPSGNTDVPTFDQLSGFDTSYQNYNAYAGIADPTNTDIYVNGWSDNQPSIENSIIVGDVVGTTGRPDSNLTGSAKPRKFITLNGILDSIQLTLSGLGMIEPYGFVFDCVDGCISLARGDKTGAVMSGAAMAPVIGAAAGETKAGVMLKKMLDAGKIPPTFALDISNQLNAKFTRTYKIMWELVGCSVPATGNCLESALYALKQNDWNGALVHVIPNGYDHYFSLFLENGSLVVTDTSQLGKIFNKGKEIIKMPFEKYNDLFLKDNTYFRVIHD